jgi:hypothetical protein
LVTVAAIVGGIVLLWTRPAGAIAPVTTPAPEPATLSLLALGIGALAVARHRK